MSASKCRETGGSRNVPGEGSSPASHVLLEAPVAQLTVLGKGCRNRLLSAHPILEQVSTQGTQ